MAVDRTGISRKGTLHSLLAAERILKELHYGCWQKRRFQEKSIVAVDRSRVSRKTTLRDFDKRKENTKSALPVSRKKGDY